MYSHDCYTTVRATEPLRRAVDHLLAQEDCDVTAELRALREGGSDEVPFELVKKMHSKLKHTPMASGRLWLHELLEGSELVLPAILPPKRSPELEARLAKLRAKGEQKEYNRMVANVDPMLSDSVSFHQIRKDVQATSRQLWMVVNFLLTVVCSFIFGFFLGYFADFQPTTCVFLGLVFGVAVFLADLYFIVRTDANADAKADAKPVSKPDAKPDAKADAKPNAKPSPKPDAKADAKADVRRDASVDKKNL